MKKNIAIATIAAFTVIAIAALAYKPIADYLNEKPVDKSIAFSVYRANAYTSDVYDQTSAQVHIVVEKVSRHTRTVVWDKIMDPKLLKQYPTIEQAMSQKITIPVRDRKEHLEVRCFLIYNSKGSELEMQDVTTVTAGQKSGKLEIGI